MSYLIMNVIKLFDNFLGVMGMLITITLGFISLSPLYYPISFLQLLSHLYVFLLLLYVPVILKWTIFMTTFGMICYILMYSSEDRHLKTIAVSPSALTHIQYFSKNDTWCFTVIRPRLAQAQRRSWCKIMIIMSVKFPLDSISQLFSLTSFFYISSVPSFKMSSENWR